MSLENKPKKIGSIDYEYKRHEILQSELNGYLNELKELANQSIGIGKVDNVKKLIENPAQYLVEMYRQLYLNNRPLHLDFPMIFENETSVKISQLEALKVKFAKTFKAMSIHSPEINGKGMTSNVKSESFDIYLDNSKAKHYEALKRFLDSLEALKEYQRLDGYFHIARAVNSLQMSNTGLEISVNDFKK
jgi:hypothetical protein